MSDSILQVNQIKDKGGNATGITVADSTANVTIGNLSATSLAGGTIASAVNFPAGHVLKHTYTLNEFTTDISRTTAGTTSDVSGNGYTVSSLTAGNRIYATVMGGYIRMASGNENYVNVGLKFAWGNGVDNTVWCSTYYLWNQQTDFQSFTGFVQGAYTIPSGVTSVELRRVIHTNSNDVDLYWSEYSSTGQDGLIQAHVWEIQQ